MPDGYRLVSAGRGTQAPDWGSDSSGTHEPFTVLRPGGGKDEDLVVVSITGFEGYQGGLAQASRGYDGEAREFSVNGRPALFSPASGEAWSEVLAVVGEDLAIRVTAANSSREQLVEVLDRVEVPADRTRAPVVDGSSDDFEVVGSMDADAVVALTPGVSPHFEEVPGPATGHAAGWLTDDGQGSLSVMTLRGGAADLAAVAEAPVFPGHRQLTVEPVAIGGRTAAILTRPDGDGWTTRAVWLQSAWGDTVVVTATGHTVPEPSVLQVLAESVEPSDDPEWEAFVTEAAGGPGLHPDNGRSEITRGMSGEVEWLLQTGPDGAGLLDMGAGPDGAMDSVDTCLKLSTRVRACPTASVGGYTDWIAYSQTGGNGMRPFVVISTTLDGTQVRVATPSEQALAPLVPVPGTRLRAAVVPVSDPGAPSCPESDDGTSYPAAGMRVEALDAEGQVTECIGPPQENS